MTFLRVLHGISCWPGTTKSDARFLPARLIRTRENGGMKAEHDSFETNPVWVDEYTAARILGLSPATLRQWRYLEKRSKIAPRIPWRKFGEAVRYYWPALIAGPGDEDKGWPN